MSRSTLTQQPVSHIFVSKARMTYEQLLARKSTDALANVIHLERIHDRDQDYLSCQHCNCESKVAARLAVRLQIGTSLTLPQAHFGVKATQCMQQATLNYASGLNSGAFLQRFERYTSVFTASRGAKANFETSMLNGCQLAFFLKRLLQGGCSSSSSSS